MSYKILVVDDEPDLEVLISQKFRNKIRDGEYEFSYVLNGAQALEKLTQDGTIQILLTDINMPIMDGLTLLSRISEQEMELKTLVISAYGDMSNIRTAMNRGAFDFVVKPIDLSDLETTLKKAISNYEVYMQGKEARLKLIDTLKEKETALLEKNEAQRQALLLAEEKEKLILEQNEMLEKKVIERTKELIDEKKKSDDLLKNILPEEVADELKQFGYAKAKYYDSVTVLFTDFVNFTGISQNLTPEELVTEIDTCYKAFDAIVEKYGIEKIKTIGDAYMCAGGLPVANDRHAVDVVSAGMEMQLFMRSHIESQKNKGLPFFELRVGIHSGPVVAGIVGVKKFAYDIWGDTVNTASRMESSGEAGKVNISGTTLALLNDKFTSVYRGKISAKGKGDIDMYFVNDMP